MQRPVPQAAGTRGEPTGTEKLVEMALSLQLPALPADVVHAAKRHLLDTIGAIVGGMQMDVASKAARVEGVARPHADGLPVPGSRLRLDAPSFAMICGTAAHGIELDDGYREGSAHPGVTVVPAVLAMSAMRKLSGQRLLEAMVVGYETVTGVSGAAHPAIRNRGFHPTPVVGTLGTALAVGRLIGLDRKQMTHALGIAASASSGLFAFLDDGGDVKRLHAGQASRAGLLAAHFAAEGISGPRNILEVPSGFAHAFAYGPERSRLIVSLPPDVPYRTPLCYIKPYACCRHLQPAIDAMLDIMQAQGLSADDIETVEVEAYSIAAAHAETGWSDFASAQLSFPYVMAIAALHGTVSLSHFDDDVRKAPAIAGLARRFSFRATSEMDALYPRQRPSRVLLRARGELFEAFAAEALGAPEKPLDDRRLEEKFDSLVAPVLGPHVARQARDLVWSLDQAVSCQPLLETLARQR